MSLIVLTVSKVQTEKDHLSPMEEWNVTNYKRNQKGKKIHKGPRTTLYTVHCMNGKPGMLLQMNWGFALTNLVWICDIFLPKISDLHLTSAKKISNEALPNLLASELYIYLLYCTRPYQIFFT